jgi:hypothetical protein
LLSVAIAKATAMPSAEQGAQIYGYIIVLKAFL